MDYTADPALPLLLLLLLRKPPHLHQGTFLPRLHIPLKAFTVYESPHGKSTQSLQRKSRQNLTSSSSYPTSSSVLASTNTGLHNPLPLCIPSLPPSPSFPGILFFSYRPCLSRLS